MLVDRYGGSGRAGRLLAHALWLMDPHKHSGLTGLLQAMGRGERGAAETALPMVYAELRGLAAGLLQREAAMATLQPTALVHEAYARLFSGASIDWESRTHFFSVAARAMRRVLVDYARERLSLKRGGDWARITLSDPDPEKQDPLDVLALDEALGELESRSEMQGRIVELRYFGGLQVAEVADALEQSKTMVERQLRVALAFLNEHLSR